MRGYNLKLLKFTFNGKKIHMQVWFRFIFSNFGTVHYSITLCAVVSDRQKITKLSILREGFKIVQGHRCRYPLPKR